MPINKYVVTWTGIVGAPGYSVHYTMSTTANPNPLQTFYNALITYLPLNATVTIPNSGETLDETTGKMVNVWSAGTQTSSVGTGDSIYVPAEGALVRWGTNSFKNGRRVLGHTFIVPLSRAAYATGGLVAAATCNAIQAASNTCRSSYGVDMVVWNRPVYKKAPVEGDPPTLVRPGSVSPITFTACPTKVAVLTSRRDI